jgi:polysaccharide export outer membrane protein
MVRTATGTGTITTTSTTKATGVASGAEGVLPRVVIVALACALGSAVSLAAAQDGSSTAPANSASLPGVRPGDVIRVWVWREKDYSGEFPVEARGVVVLPLLGEISVPGKTAEALADTLREAYRKYLNNPSIQITVLRRIAVQGEVVKPGLYPADATITIGELIALAGGVTPGGNPKKIRLVREGRVIVSGLGPGTVLQQSPVQSGDAVFVPQKGWLARNGGAFLWGGVSLVTAVLAAVLVR